LPVAAKVIDGGTTRQAEQKGMCTMPLAEQGSCCGAGDLAFSPISIPLMC